MKKAGESFRELVTIVKVKNGIPTVVTISGHVYTLRSPDQHKGGRSK